MKANRVFRRNEAAVSPVLGTLLGVAIAVALTASVWFMINLLTKSSEATPQIGFTKSGLVLTVAASPEQSLDWFKDIRPSGTCAAGLQLAPNGGTPAPYPTAAGTKVIGGDKLSGCTAGQTLVLSHIGTNRVMFQTTF